MIKECNNCGTSFETRFSYQKYCSDNCSTHYKIKKEFGKDISFDLIIFNLKNNTQKIIQTTPEFLAEFNNKYPYNKFNVEEAALFYYQKEGYEINDCSCTRHNKFNSITKGYCDLIIKKEDTYYVEVKSLNDSLRFSQFLFLFEKLKKSNALVVYVIPKNITKQLIKLEAIN